MDKDQDEQGSRLRGIKMAKVLDSDRQGSRWTEIIQWLKDDQDQVEIVLRQTKTKMDQDQHGQGSRLIKIKMDTGQRSLQTGIKMERDQYRQGSRWTGIKMYQDQDGPGSGWTGIKCSGIKIVKMDRNQGG